MDIIINQHGNKINITAYEVNITARSIRLDTKCGIERNGLNQSQPCTHTNITSPIKVVNFYTYSAIFPSFKNNIYSTPSSHKIEILTLSIIL